MTGNKRARINRVCKFWLYHFATTTGCGVGGVTGAKRRVCIIVGYSRVFYIYYRVSGSLILSIDFYKYDGGDEIIKVETDRSDGDRDGRIYQE